MTPKNPTTKDVEKSFYSNFMQRAQECFHAASYSCKHQEWTAAAINAIHATIAACDAMCVYFLGKKSAGESHNQAITLFKTIKNSKEISVNANSNILFAIFFRKCKAICHPLIEEMYSAFIKLLVF